MIRSSSYKQAPAAASYPDFAANLRVFNFLAKSGFSPEWKPDSVVAYVPGITLGTNGQPNTTFYSPTIVRSFSQAFRLARDCN